MFLSLPYCSRDKSDQGSFCFRDKSSSEMQNYTCFTFHAVIIFCISQSHRRWWCTLVLFPDTGMLLKMKDVKRSTPLSRNPNFQIEQIQKLMGWRNKTPQSGFLPFLPSISVYFKTSPSQSTPPNQNFPELVKMSSINYWWNRQEPDHFL